MSWWIAHGSNILPCLDQCLLSLDMDPPWRIVGLIDLLLYSRFEWVGK